MTENLDPVAYNRAAWDREVDRGNEWTRPVGPEVTARARAGDWSVVLIGYEPVPRDWFPADINGTPVLCLASGGGQQGPVLAAAGADVTVFDNSPRQLARDEEVAARDGLVIRTVLGDMRDLSAFADGGFDLVFNPVSNVFCPDLARLHPDAPGRGAASGRRHRQVYAWILRHPRRQAASPLTSRGSPRSRSRTGRARAPPARAGPRAASGPPAGTRPRRRPRAPWRRPERP